MQLKDVDWTRYYEHAEPRAEDQWNQYLEPIVSKHEFNFDVVLDFACGHGRIAEIVKTLAGRLYCCDIRQDAIDFCNQRFAPEVETGKVLCLRNTETTIPCDSNSISFLYSWDALVHFSVDELVPVIREFARVLRPGGHGMIHHSNFGSFFTQAAALISLLKMDKSERVWGKPYMPLWSGMRNFKENPHWRAGVSAKDVDRLCRENALIPIRQTSISWGYRNLDCITVFQKPSRHM